MDQPTPTPTGDCLHGIWQNLDSLTPTGVDSDFDESLAVPESLSVIDIEKVNNKEETDAAGKYILFIYFTLHNGHN